VDERPSTAVDERLLEGGWMKRLIAGFPPASVYIV
jgi:hypothetical protein